MFSEKGPEAVPAEHNSALQDSRVVAKYSAIRRMVGAT